MEFLFLKLAMLKFCFETYLFYCYVTTWRCNHAYFCSLQVPNSISYITYCDVLCFVCSFLAVQTCVFLLCFTFLSISFYFQALNIETEDDVTKLTNLFHQYAKQTPKAEISKDINYKSLIMQYMARALSIV